MRASEILLENYFIEDDKLSPFDHHSTRRFGITLKEINRRRRRKEMQKILDQERKKFLPTMYNQPTQ